MDRSIWATWYDLPKEDEEEHNDWLHHTHIKDTLKRSGYMWAAHYELVDRESPKSKKKDHLAYTDDPSIPNGTEFLLLFGAASAEVFLSPNPAQLAETYSDETKAMIAKNRRAHRHIHRSRQGERPRRRHPRGGRRARADSPDGHVQLLHARGRF